MPEKAVHNIISCEKFHGKSSIDEEPLQSKLNS